MAMVCKRCPHHVRHGQVAEDKKSFVFKEQCSLKMRVGSQSVDKTCKHHPFTAQFNYIECDVYHATFKSTGLRNDVMPTTDFQFTDALGSSSLTEMDLL